MTVVIHVGAGKTGTTTLQKNLLGQHPSILSIGRPYPNREWRLLLEDLQYDDDYEFPAEKFLQMCRAAVADARERSLVLSDESLGHPVQQSTVARRLKSALPEAEILITIRNQYHVMISAWVQNFSVLKRVPSPFLGRYVSFDDWFEFQREHVKGRGVHAGYFKCLDYYRLYAIYSQAFGRDRVHVLPFEELLRESDRYYAKLAALFSIDASDVAAAFGKRIKERKRVARMKYEFFESRFPSIRKIRRVLPDRANYHINRLLNSGRPYEHALRPDQRTVIERFYAEGNQALNAALGLGLERWAYPGLRQPDRSKQSTPRRPLPS